MIGHLRNAEEAFRLFGNDPPMASRLFDLDQSTRHLGSGSS